MAIIIPSKYISSMKNPKVRDNYIDNVEVNYTVISPNNKFEEVVYTETFKDNLFNKTDEASSEIAYRSAYWGGRSELYAYIYASQSWRNFSVKINKNPKNSFISKVFTGIKTVEQEETSNETSWIGSNVVYKKATAKASLPVTNASYNLSGLVSYTVGELFIGDKTIEQKTNETIPLAITSSSCTFETQSAYSTVSASVSLPNRNNILRPQINEDEDYYIFNITLLTESISIPLKLIKGTVEQSATFTMTGTCEVYVAEEVSLTFYGNTIGIDLKNGTVTVGSGDFPFSTNSNELIHTGATTYGQDITSYIGENILNQYREGKETCTVKCSISDYYTESGDLAISPHKGEVPMTFSIGDEVIPMVYTVNKTDRAMSKYSNGMDKVFVVVGVKPSYTGACWQELTLLEKTE